MSKRVRRQDIEGHRKYFLLNDNSPFNIKEAYKAIRTNMLSVLSICEGPKIFAFTSAEPGDGKTGSCANIAVTFAQMGAKVLLIDADLRKPKMNRIFHLVNNNGLSRYLTGQCPLTGEHGAIKETQYENLYVMTSGKIPPNPSELLLSKNFDNMLEEISTQFDYIFIDSPPVCAVTDSIVISGKTLGCFVVVRHKLTRKDVLKAALNEIQNGGGKVLGILLNDFRADKVDSPTEYRYGYRSYYYDKD